MVVGARRLESQLSQHRIVVVRQLEELDVRRAVEKRFECRQHERDDNGDSGATEKRAKQIEPESGQRRIAFGKKIDGEYDDQVHAADEDTGFDKRRPLLVLNHPQDRTEARQKAEDTELQISGHQSVGHGKDYRSDQRGRGVFQECNQDRYRGQRNQVLVGSDIIERRGNDLPSHRAENEEKDSRQGELKDDDQTD